MKRWTKQRKMTIHCYRGVSRLQLQRWCLFSFSFKGSLLFWHRDEGCVSKNQPISCKLQENLLKVSGKTFLLLRFFSWLREKTRKNKGDYDPYKKIKRPAGSDWRSTGDFSWKRRPFQSSSQPVTALLISSGPDCLSSKKKRKEGRLKGFFVVEYWEPALSFESLSDRLNGNMKTSKSSRF